ncbi:ATP synthase f chain, mitochondrial precursor, variant 2 [Orbilia oligospora]|uniref:ATP synthase f chain, mitochondrial, variant 2 n=1 Tax=Orbilia oligospora TaxID=2813651 RepID=A0A7C8J6C0_ORBOL|nr:ATP synthase f chain, mitochondrial precursor, variant 2 [Orbilia oligospora]KAF3082621.1 ATP synthase f chain, mitochondrial precursor, variant 2 [Orbilia oligospora]KAF3097705.1 ATP synthase f chain, mitochondrial precursor, variant 2 [Orbilia oligospora]KAF3145763.1 ATP synthase f chain, mitochondrial precursor, variant 2 [Orbilia oligospora]
MARLVELYTKLPKGPAPKIQGKGLIGRYKAKYFDGENASAARMFVLVSKMNPHEGFIDEYIYQNGYIGN